MLPSERLYAISRIILFLQKTVVVYENSRLKTRSNGCLGNLDMDQIINVYGGVLAARVTEVLSEKN